LCLDRRLLRVLQPPNFGHHHDYVIGGVLSGSVRHSQPDASSVESSRRPDHNLIVPSGVDAKIEP
jgi:hypothetical protein